MTTRRFRRLFAIAAALLPFSRTGINRMRGGVDPRMPPRWPVQVLHLDLGSAR